MKDYIFLYYVPLYFFTYGFSNIFLKMKKKLSVYLVVLLNGNGDSVELGNTARRSDSLHKRLIKD